MKIEKHICQRKENVIAELYRELRNRGIEAYISYQVPGMQFDLVTAADGEIKAIVEVKKSRKQYGAQGGGISRYYGIGIPVILMVGMSEIQKVVRVLQKASEGERIDPVYRFIGE